MISTLYNACVFTPHSDLLAKLDSAEATGDSKSTTEERGGASETKATTGSSDSDAGGGRGNTENSLTYTKEQVEVVQRSA